LVGVEAGKKQRLLRALVDLVMVEMGVAVAAVLVLGQAIIMVLELQTKVLEVEN
jgi:hypothetical protein